MIAYVSTANTPLHWYTWEGTRLQQGYAARRENVSGTIQAPSAEIAVHRLNHQAEPVRVVYIAECSAPVDAAAALAWIGKTAFTGLIWASVFWTVILAPAVGYMVFGAVAGTVLATYYKVRVFKAQEAAALAVTAAEQAIEASARALNAATADADNQLAAQDPEYLASLRSTRRA